MGIGVNWNWDHIRFFLALSENGTLTDAAKALQVSHSTVLRRIKSFEKQLDTKLFEQRPEGYFLTLAGQKLFEECSKVKQRIQAISQQISGLDHELAGEIVITTTDTLAQYILPKALHEIQTDYPSLQFTLQMANQVSDLNNREADIAIRPCLKPPDDLIGRKVGNLKFSVVASKNYAREHRLVGYPTKDQQLRFIRLDKSYSELPFYGWFMDRIGESSSQTVVNNFINAAALARADMGITLLPSYILEHEQDLVALTIEGTIPHNDLWLLSHINLRNTDRVKLVKDLLYKALRKKLI